MVGNQLSRKIIRFTLVFCGVTTWVLYGVGYFRTLTLPNGSPDFPMLVYLLEGLLPGLLCFAVALLLGPGGARSPAPIPNDRGKSYARHQRAAELTLFIMGFAVCLGSVYMGISQAFTPVHVDPPSIRLTMYLGLARSVFTGLSLGVVSVGLGTYFRELRLGHA
jgi:hypothetical protein